MSTKRIKDPIMDAVQDSLLKRPEPTPAVVTTGMPVLDLILGGGFAPGKLVVLGGKHSPEPAGKSVLWQRVLEAQQEPES